MGSLLAGVAHELNNPLAILMAQATLLQDMQPPPSPAVKRVPIASTPPRNARGAS